MNGSNRNSVRLDANPPQARSRSVTRIADGSFSKPFRVAIAGNPNTGKTTLFNVLTKSRLHTGNYPGVTVEQAEGRIRWGAHWFDFVDLPGTFSLSTEHREEGIAFDAIVGERPDVVIDVADASQLERHLYLGIELMELGVPVVLALNFWDVAREKGQTIDVALLSLLLGVSAVPTIARTGEGVERLLANVARVCQGRVQGRFEPLRVDYGGDVEPCLRKLTLEVGQCEACAACPRWHAIKLLEGDEQCLHRFRCLCPRRSGRIIQETTRLRKEIERLRGEDMGVTGITRRYEYAKQLCSLVISASVQSVPSRGTRIDRVLLNRWLGPICFALVMYLVFQLTFTVAQPLVGGLETATEWLRQTVSSCWPQGSESGVRSLLVDGVIGGVGGVAVFLPNLLVLFLCLALLEQSGYMVRAMFILDRLLHRIGLPGNSFIPMMIGFGCTVPAILAARTLTTREDRLTTIFVLPLISCSARLPIYTLIISAFFVPRYQAPILWAVYITGIVLAIGAAKLLRLAWLKGSSAPFIMELPPIHVPSLKEMLRQMWDRTGSFLKTAGTIILAISVLLWALSVWPALPAGQRFQWAERRSAVQASHELDAEQKERVLAKMDAEVARLKLEHSAIGRLGRGLAPVFQPVGFDWKMTTALLGAFAAKEVFLAQMAVVHAVGKTGDSPRTLREILQQDYTPLQGVCVMLFCLIGPPCMATLAVTRQETKTWKWPMLQWSGLAALAYVLTLLVYQLGRFLLGPSA